MHARTIRDGIQHIPMVHWDRRLFDSLVPLPDGTSYNAYLVEGRDATALIDTTDPLFQEEFMEQLQNVESIDYIISQHSEQDHSGAIPAVMARFPKAKVICSAKAKDLLNTHVGIPSDQLVVVEDGETISLGGKTLQFIYTPWVHWPETMSTYVPEDKCLFSCDFFGSHLATTDSFVTDEAQVYEPAKRYYAEIMMPFRNFIVKNLEKIGKLEFDMIAPSHGPVYGNATFILDAYRDWVSPQMKNEVVLPYISMHGSTEAMVKHLTDSLAQQDVTVYPFNLEVTDIGKLAIKLVDAATLIVGTPTVHVGAHPSVFYAAHLANLLRPKVKYGAVIGSYGWGSKAVDQIVEATAKLKLEVLGTVIEKGCPTAETFEKLDALASAVAKAHKEDDLISV